MEKAVRSFSPIPRLVVVLALGLTACSRPAADVPITSGAGMTPALSPTEQAMSCADIDRDLGRTATERGEIEGDSDTTQKVGMGIYSAGPLAYPLFVVGPLFMASEANEGRKDQLARIQTERDRLIALRAVKSCSAAAVDPATGRILTDKR